MSINTLTITPIPAFKDNYIWLLETGTPACAVVDPGDHRPVIRALKERGLVLEAILVTHHHPDHVGGIPGLLQRWPVRVLAPRDTRLPGTYETVVEGDTVSLDELGLKFGVIEVPGHTASHVAYHGHGALFCGDTLFSAGCGRLFEGTPEQMQRSLDKLAALPPATKIYCAHEYTRSNCAFALAVDPDNADLCAMALHVAQLREQGLPTLPSTLELELQVNPFLRSRSAAVVKAARHIDPDVTPGAATLGVIRDWKDRF